MRSLLLTTLSLLILLAAGCSRQESADAGQLLATVPSDASAVAVVNLRSILEKAGCKTDGSEITAGPEALQAAKSLSDKQFSRLATLFLSGKSGIDPSVGLFFAEGDAIFNLGSLADPDMFKKAIVAEWGGEFSSVQGIEINKNLAVKGNLYWARIDGRDVEPEDINRFVSLSERQSILASDLSKPLVRIDTDVQGWGNIAGLLSASGMEFTKRGMVTMSLQTLLDDPSDISFSLSFGKGEFIATAKVLNSKGKTSKLLIPAGEIDLETMKSLKGSGNYIFAIALPQKLIKSLSKDISGKGPSMLAIILQALAPIDGTSVLIGSEDPNAMEGVVTTTGENLVQLTDLLNETGLKVTRDGKFLRLSNGTPSGPADIQKVAPSFKGAMVGVYGAGMPVEMPGKALPADSLKTGKRNANFPASTSMMLLPADGGVTFNVKLTSSDPDTNFLLSLLKESN